MNQVHFYENFVLCSSVGSLFLFSTTGFFFSHSKPTFRRPSSLFLWQEENVTSQETNLVARCRRVYGHAHDYHINSISNNSDGETFISADDLRINLWNLEISNQSFNIVDVKPANMEDLTENLHGRESDDNDDDDDDGDDDGESNNSSGFEMELTRDAIAFSLMNSL
ncbi:serine/threonine-protein phosphatase 2A 55 kDa regulatory subunit B beta isoform isoform X2 [Gossypium hirsutum]|uniref:Serine/threonine-protein phosphatase 2A 55 kDa regulatory subunit B beta isoform isoform X2 n=1 Tax=Gossypium hirsutum TaxID=3635 RepID=A0ABM3A8J5_GOSHI|nr:serine/threonine-protein phosphatase 2A 55 kDa regulatory subunit B beta isoform isoform X2 [Gossypium hirsutum]